MTRTMFKGIMAKTLEEQKVLADETSTLKLLLAKG